MAFQFVLCEDCEANLQKAGHREAGHAESPPGRTSGCLLGTLAGCLCILACLTIFAASAALEPVAALAVGGVTILTSLPAFLMYLGDCRPGSNVRAFTRVVGA